MHLPSYRPSVLAGILGWRAHLPVSYPESGEAILPGRIYVAPPDYHLVIGRDQHIRLWHGPKENNFRPAINPTFRSAADVFGSRVVGVVMTGRLEDGVAGLEWIKRHGGVTVVQDPEEAPFPEMPRSALLHVQVDYVIKLAALAPLLVELVNGASPKLVYGERKEAL